MCSKSHGYGLYYAPIKISRKVALEQNDNKLRWKEPFGDDSNEIIVFQIHYHGVRNYELLFPRVTNDELRKRLGRYYEEAEKSFDEGIWLSYALMCGAIFEGILFDKDSVVDKEFYRRIEDARINNWIDDGTATIMHKARNFRNLIHANKYRNDYIERADAMDIRTAMDKIIRSPI